MREGTRRYKKQRDAVITVALIIILALTVVHQVIFYKQLDNFDQLEEVVQSYRKRCESQQKQIVDLTEQINWLEYENSQMQNDTNETRLYFVPDTWELKATQAAKIYQSIPLDKDLQEYVWELCVYLEIPECYETILAIMWQETHFDPSLTSITNDYGLMQINEINIAVLHDTLGITDIMAIRQHK